MTQRERYDRMIAYFEQARPTAQTELHYSDPFQLLVATILSAQCTDKRVNMTTPALFAAFPDAAAMAKATPEEIFAYIHSISYPNNKSKHLAGMARKLVEDFGGVVPDDVDELQTLPGVGRKTANVIASVVFNLPALAVDTHVFRIAHKLKLSNAKDPSTTEQDLLKIIPSELWGPVNHQWILFGRAVCIANRPRCEDCFLADLCPNCGKESGGKSKAGAKARKNTRKAGKQGSKA
jgi:endonuclease-3